MPEVKQTKNYSVFNVMNINRDINEKHVEVLKNSIRKNNLLQFRPLLVTDKMEIIDGQHRLEAAKQLNIPVWYTISEDAQPDDIILLNSCSMDWKSEDYLKYYCKKGLQPYLDFKRIMEKYEVPIGRLIRMVVAKKSPGKSFQRGELGPIKEHLLIPIITHIHEVQDLIKEALPHQARRFLMQNTFFNALATFFKFEEIDPDIFKKKVLQKLTYLQSRSTIYDYIKLFEDIYNYRSHAPVTVSDMV